MSTRQRQDLTIFNDNTIFPENLFDFTLFNPFLGLITSIEGTSPIWLINTLIEQLLFNKCRINSSSSSSHNDTRSTSMGVETILISFSNDLNYYNYYFKKISGSELINNKDFKFINCFDDLFTKLLPNGDISESSINKNLFELILKQISNNTKKIIIIDNIELLLSSTKTNPINILKFIKKLQHVSQGLIISSSIDDPLIDFSNINPNSLESQITKLYSSLYHKSNFIVNIKPLSTGRADDVTGNMRISKGMIDIESLNKSKNIGLKIQEKEYLYFVKKDFTVDLFYK